MNVQLTSFCLLLMDQMMEKLRGGKHARIIRRTEERKKDQQKNSSLKEEEDEPVVEFDDEIDQVLQEKIDREVEEFARRLNCTWEERKIEILRDAGNHKEITT